MFKQHKNKIKIFFFCAIFCLIQAPVFLSGEIIPTRVIIAIQDSIGEDFLYSKAHTEDTSYYKFTLANQNAAEVLVIGSSRTLQIQGFFFDEDTSFYNAGLIASSLPDILLALESLDEDSLPEVAILSLDEYYFNETWYEESNIGAFPQEPVTGVSLYTAGAIGVYEELRRDPSFFKILCTQPSKISTGAKGYDHGYGLDGAFAYGSVYANPYYTSDQRVAETVELIQNATGRYCAGDTVCAEALEALSEIAAFCTAHDITLVTFSPPISQSALDAIDARDDMDYFYQFADEVSTIAAQQGFEFYDFTDPALLNADDEYFVDGFHGSDVIYLRALISMIEQGSCLVDYAKDLATLQEMDANAISTLQVQ